MREAQARADSKCTPREGHVADQDRNLVDPPPPSPLPFPYFNNPRKCSARRGVVWRCCGAVQAGMTRVSAVRGSATLEEP